MTPPRTTAYEHILDQALTHAGLNRSLATASPIRLGENAIIGFPDLVARIARPGQEKAARREVVVARWLTDHGFPVTTPLDVEQPIVIEGRAVTFWEVLPEHTPGTVEDVALLLRDLHALPLPTHLDLGHLDPFVRLPQRIDDAVGLAEEDVAWLRKRLDSLREAWSQLPDGRPHTVVHGDAWIGNVARHTHGAVLLDLERCSVGPPEWDLVSTAIKTSSVPWLGREEYDRFVRVYGGHDVTDWPGFTLMRDLRELRMTLYFVQHSDQERMRTEAQLRIDCLRGHHGKRPWPWTPAA
ncbi:aminoglycoside phosphotransferase family protein [Nocardiopsis dassonvillei]|uniref:aminoglycoside phosphotransferase family protein n=1 Tax=Nocardiopsis dassonvillei TaxID=2014 RepID=UPI00034C7930|nr:aminoglycoside phosphotransferase family protein [Nocardiopsis dassonvillei]MCK9872385.1 aminoglycoside phosphotransferase family protein [Nocardiopsis dassonvillei]